MESEYIYEVQTIFDENNDFITEALEDKNIIVEEVSEVEEDE